LWQAVNCPTLRQSENDSCRAIRPLPHILARFPPSPPHFLIVLPDRKAYRLFREAEAAGSETPRTPVEWAFDYLWNMPEVSICLSGMGTMQQVDDNILYAGRSSVGMLSSEDEEVIDNVQKQFAYYNVVPCTGCAYCQPCPMDVTIPYHLRLYNEYQTSGDYAANKKLSDQWLPLLGGYACEECTQCEDICPQRLPITDLLPKVLETFKR
jgi:predicted aldo/keto reductase-like oxidoreductase